MHKALAAAIIAACLMAPVAEAHLLKTDGDIGVLMHVDPNDEPVARQPATFFFEIKDRSGRFAGADCDCRLRVMKDRPIAEEAAKAGTGGMTAVYTFSEAGVYRIELSGVPRAVPSAVPHKAGGFAAFRVPFDVRVEADGAPTSTRVWFLLAIVAGAGLLALAAWAIIRVLRDMGR